MVNWKVYGGKWSWPYLRYSSGVFLKLGGRAQNVSQDSRNPYRDFNPGHPEYEVEVLPARIRHSVKIVLIGFKSTDCPGNGVLRLVVLVLGFMFHRLLILFSVSP
jgi:hypothetical protein